MQRWALAITLTTAATACDGAGPAAPDPDQGFSARARTLSSIEGSLLETTLEVHNRSAETRVLVYGGCLSGSVVRLYDPRRPQAPVWSNAPPPGAVCAAVRIELRLAPGQTHVFVRQDRVEEILGDSLPPGRYRVTVQPSFEGPTLPEIEVGQHDLAF